MNYLTYPLKIMNITQSYSDNYTHLRHSKGNLKDYPIDDACGSGINSYFYTPCDEVVVKKIYGVGMSASNTLWIESTTPVITPTFTDYVTIMIVHPDDKEFKNIYVGKKYKRGESIFQKGSDGNATGPHFHITVGRGKFYGGGWQKNNLGLWILKTTKYNIKPDQAFFIDPKFTEVINTRNIDFKILYEETITGNEYYTTVNLNIRYGPGTNYKVVNTLPKNTKLNILNIENNWAKISEKEYVYLEYLTQTKPSSYYETTTTTAYFLNVRNKPNGKILFTIPKNTTIAKISNKGSWTQIYSNRWVSSNYLNK